MKGVLNLNNKKWMSTLMNKSKKINMFGKKKTNKGTVWASLIGLGMSAAAYGVGRSQSQNKNQTNPLQSLMKNIQQGSKNISIPNMAGLTEFSEELNPKKENSNRNTEQNDESNFSETVPTEDLFSNDKNF